MSSGFESLLPATSRRPSASFVARRPIQAHRNSPSAQLRFASAHYEWARIPASSQLSRIQENLLNIRILSGLQALDRFESQPVPSDGRTSQTTALPRAASTEPRCTHSWRALLGLEFDVHDLVAIAESCRPLEVVHRDPVARSTPAGGLSSTHAREVETACAGKTT